MLVLSPVNPALFFIMLSSSTLWTTPSNQRHILNFLKIILKFPDISPPHSWSKTADKADSPAPISCYRISRDSLRKLTNWIKTNLILTKSWLVPDTFYICKEKVFFLQLFTQLTYLLRKTRHSSEWGNPALSSSWWECGGIVYILYMRKFEPKLQIIKSLWNKTNKYRKSFKRTHYMSVTKKAFRVWHHPWLFMKWLKYSGILDRGTQSK